MCIEVTSLSSPADAGGVKRSRLGNPCAGVFGGGDHSPVEMESFGRAEIGVGSVWVIVGRVFVTTNVPGGICSWRPSQDSVPEVTLQPASLAA